MADKKVSREIFEAIMKEMVGTFRPSHDDGSDPFRSSGPSRSTPRSQRYDDSFESERYSSPRDEYRSRVPDSRRASYSTPSRRNVEGVRSPPYFSDPRRSRSPHRSDDYYFNNRGDGRDREFLHPRDAEWSNERNYRRPARRDDSFDEGDLGGSKRGYGRPDGHVSRGRIAYLERRQTSASRGQQRGAIADRGQRGAAATRGQRGGVASKGQLRGGVSPRGQPRGGAAVRGQQRGGIAARGQPGQRGGAVARGRGANQRGKAGHRGAFAGRGRGNKSQGPGVVNGKKPRPNREEKIYGLMSGSDAWSKLGSKIVRWSGFNKANTGEFEHKNPAYTTVETATFANTLASFKCALKPELRYQCFLTVKAPNHPALKKPTVDADFLSMLVDKGIVDSRKTFSDIINPLDKYLTSFQQCLLKSVHPLLLACNAYDLNMKHGFAGATDLSTAYESAVSLCRKSLVLFGQTYSIASSLRQEKILEHVGLQEMAPKPTDFPNLEDSALFGKKYMTQLKAWLEKSGYPMHLQSDQARKPTQEVLTPEPKVKEMVDNLLENAVNSLKEKKNTDAEGDADMEGADEQEKPELWFLFDQASQEFKYYHQKLAELQKLQQAEVEAKRAQLKAAAAVSLAAKSGPSKTLTDPQFDEVDAKTRETAENLARFMIQLGSNLEDFNMDSLTSNPDFWFLTKKESPAHKFYQMKLTEFRESTDTKDEEPAITEDTDVTSDDAEPKDTELAKAEDTDLQDSLVSDTQVIDNDSEVVEVECESTESAATSTPTTSLPQRKRGLQKGSRAGTPKKSSLAEETKADDPVKTGNEKTTGRAGLRKKQKLNDEQGSEETPTKGTASGDEDSVTGQQSNEDSFDVTE